MIRIKRRNPDLPVLTEMELAGQTFEIELVPFPEKDLYKELSAFRRTKNAYNPVSKRMEVIAHFDDTDPKYLQLTDDLLDRIVRNFHGLADEQGKPLDGTVRENKLLLGQVRVEDYEEIPIEDQGGERAVIRQKRTRFLRSLIFDKAAELAATTAEAERKNSLSSPVIPADEASR